MEYIPRYLDVFQLKGRKAYLLVTISATIIALLASIFMTLWSLYTLARGYQDVLTKYDRDLTSMEQSYRDAIERKQKVRWLGEAIHLIGIIAENFSYHDAKSYEEAIDLYFRRVNGLPPDHACITVEKDDETEPVFVNWRRVEALPNPEPYCQKHRLRTTDEKLVQHELGNHDLRYSFGEHEMPPDHLGLRRFHVYSTFRNKQHDTRLHITLITPADVDGLPRRPEAVSPVATGTQHLFIWITLGTVAIAIGLLVVLRFQFVTLSGFLQTSGGFQITRLAEDTHNKLHTLIAQVRLIAGDKAKAKAVTAQLREAINLNLELRDNARALRRQATAWVGRPEPVDVAAVARGTIVKYNLTSDDCDFRQHDTIMQQVSDADVADLFQNLLDNACKHGEPPITVTLRRTVNAASGHDEIDIEVTNAGSPYTDVESDGRGLRILRAITTKYRGQFQITEGPNGRGATAWAHLKV